jgi:lipopolysaccharide/colanic/teichoic acid biosynthesis glycosyltransferase
MQLPVRGTQTTPPAAASRVFPPLAATRRTAPAHLPRFHNPSASPWALSRSKRLFDLAAALLMLTLLAVPMLAIALAIRLTSRGPALFVQKRVGRGGRLFGICKFRSMVVGASAGHGLTADGDRRVTTIGRWMRRFKIDELPQLFNILRGDMSLVGPRPKLPQYEGILNMPYRPGVTGAATLVFRGEESLLMNIRPSELDFFYAQRIKPLKASIDVRYMSQATCWSDLRMIAQTAMTCLRPSHVPGELLYDEEQLGTESVIA